MRVTVTPDQIRAAFEAVKDDPSFDERLPVLNLLALRPGRHREHPRKAA
jgi:hypothetical protein